jgi:thiol-disulfide isomerase/thioredoxin
MIADIIYAEHKSRVNGAKAGSDDLWLERADLTTASGWQLKPEGACKGDVCVPIPPAREAEFIRDSGTSFNLAALARHLGQPVVHDDKSGTWYFGEAAANRRATLASLQAPDFELPDLDGKTHRLVDYRGKKVLLYAWASWCGCRVDLPVWQGIYEELKDHGFTIVAVALDSAGAPAVRDFIRPASTELPPRLKDIMGWDDAFTERAGVPQYPCLIDQKHIVGELYEFINVPMVVWIDENGRVVRPAEPAGVTEGIRAMDLKTRLLPKDVIDEAKHLRRTYVDAIRDWVVKGERSEFSLSSGEARRRASGPDDTDALATANFRLGEYLFEKGLRDEALKYFAEARRLRPESWCFKRQTWELEQTGKASGPEFFAEVMALGNDHYYAPLVMKELAK